MRAQHKHPSIVRELSTLLICGSVFAIVVLIFINYTSKQPEPQLTLLEAEAQLANSVWWGWFWTIAGLSLGAVACIVALAVSLVVLGWGVNKWRARNHITPNANGDLPVVPIEYSGYDEYGHKIRYKILADLEQSPAAVTKFSMNGNVKIDTHGEDLHLANQISSRRKRNVSEARKVKQQFINGKVKGGKAPTKNELHYEVDNAIREQVLIRERAKTQKLLNTPQSKTHVESFAIEQKPRLDFLRATMPHKGNGQIVLGQDVANGNKAIWELSVGPHYRVLGSSGSGKSMIVQSIVAQMISSKIETIVLDVERADFESFGDHIQLIDTNEPRIFHAALEAIWEYYLERMEIIRENHVGTQAKYDNLLPHIKMNRVCIVIDEFTGQMFNSSDIPEVPDLLDDIAARVRKAGMHMILADQRPMADVMSGRLRNNFRNYLVGIMPEDSLSPIKAKRPLKDYEFNWSGGGIITGWDITKVLESIPDASKPAQHIDIGGAVQLAEASTVTKQDDGLTPKQKQAVEFVLANPGLSIDKTYQKSIADKCKISKSYIKFARGYISENNLVIN